MGFYFTIHTGLVALIVVCSGSVTSSQQLQCKARPGCKFSGCGSITDASTSDPDRNEFPILCKGKSMSSVTSESSVSANLQIQLQLSMKESKLEKDIRSLKRYTALLSDKNHALEQNNHVLEQNFAQLKKEFHNLESSTASLTETTRKLERNYAHIKQDIVGMTSSRRMEIRKKGTESDCANQKGLLSHGKCFTFHINNRMTYDEAAIACAKRGTLLAEIQDQNQQIELMNFIRDNYAWNGDHVIQVWLATKYEPSTTKLISRSGKELNASFLKWRPDFFNDTSTGIALYIVKKRGYYNGLQNYQHDIILPGSLCEKDTRDWDSTDFLKRYGMLEQSYMKLKRDLEETKHLSSDLTRTEMSEMSCKKEEGLFAYGKCFFIPYMTRVGVYMTYSETVGKCKEYGAVLAEIHDWTQQSVLNRFIQTKMPLPSEWTYVYVRIGMQYDNQTSKLVYRSGKELDSNELSWYRKDEDGISPYLKFKVVPAGSSWLTGIMNAFEHYSETGAVLCEKNV